MTAAPPPSSDPVDRVRIPGMLLVAHGVLASLAAVAQGMMALAATIGLALVDAATFMPEPDWAAELNVMMAVTNLLGTVLGLGWTALQFALSVLIVWGGLRMMALRDRSVAILGAVAAVVPGLSSCCLSPIGMIAGVWALVLLFDEEIADVFEHHDHPTPLGPPSDSGAPPRQYP